VVPLEYCEKKIQECKVEEAVLESALDNVVSQSDDHQNLKLIIHDLAFKVKEIYGKANIDEKKMFLSQLFTNFSQNGYDIKPNYNLACEYLLEWMPRLNESYELQKTLDIKGLNARNDFQTNTLLQRWEDVRTYLVGK